MSGWITDLTTLAAAGGDGVMVTVAVAGGSTPREAGAKMVVTADRLYGTIGGGHLEFRATEIARERLTAETDDGTDDAPSLVKFPLGPSLGQCCGGNATLLFEPLRLAAATPDWLVAAERSARAGPAGALVTIVSGPEAGAKIVVTGDDATGGLRDAATTKRAVALARAALTPTALSEAAPAALYTPSDAPMLFVERLGAEAFDIVLFGAGHVGNALVAVLSGLPCRITWIDHRAALFPNTLPAHIRTIVTDAPEYEVDAAPAGSYVLVMTHSHQRDLALAERILRRGAFAYFGLIGSRSKRRQFEKRLAHRGLSAATIRRMTCPIGLSGVGGKHPAEIAIAVAGEILRHRRRGEARAATDAGALSA